MKRTGLRGLLPLVCVTGWTALLAVWTYGGTAFTSFSAAAAAPGPLPRATPELRLVGSDGQPRTLAASSGRWRLVNFFYLSCTGVCQANTARIEGVREELGDLVGPRLEIVSVSVDSDPPERLAELRRLYGDPPGWTFASLADPDAARTYERFGVLVVRRPDGLVNHGTDLYLLDPDSRLVRIFGAGDARSIAARIRDALR